MTPEQLAEIEQRAENVKTWKPGFSTEPIPQICDVDVPALVAEVKRLRNLWAAVARDARNFAAEARGRREHGERLTADRDAARAEVVQLCQERLQLVAERDEARAGWTKAVEIATEASNQRDQALAALETAVDALRSGT